MLNNVPKDILLKLIPIIEDEYKQKYLETKRELDMMNVCCKYRVKKKKCADDSCENFCFVHDTNLEGDSDDGGTDKVMVVTNYNPNEFTHVENIILDYYGSEDDCCESLHEHDLFGAICYYGCEKWYCKNHWKENSLFLKKACFCKECGLSNERDEQFT